MAEVDSAQKVNIIGINGQSPPAWCTEKTLSEIKGLTAGSVKLLKEIAKADKKLNDEVDKLIKTVDTGTVAQKQGQTVTVAQNKTLIEKIEKGFGGLKRVLGINVDMLQAPFEMAGTGLRRFSEQIKDTSPKLGAWAKGIGIGTVIFGELVSIIGKNNDAMLKMYGNGLLVQNGFTGLANGAMAAGLGAHEFADLLTKNSNVAVALGTKRTMALTKMFAETTSYGSTLLMKSKESQEALFEVMDTAQSLGILRNMNDAQINSFTVDYLKNINELSQATGKSRDEIRKQTQQAAKSVDTFAALNQLPKEQREFMMKEMMPTMVAQFGEQTGGVLSQSLSRYMSRGMSGIDPSMRLMMSRLGGGMGDAFNEMAQAGKIGDQAGFKRANEKFLTGLENMSDSQAKLLDLQAQYGTGASKEFARQLLAMRQSTMAMADRRKEEEKSIAEEVERRNKNNKENVTADQVRAERKQREKDEQNALKETTEAMNKSRVAMANLQTTIYKLIEQLAPVLIPALEKLATATIHVIKGFNWIVDKLTNMFKSVFGDDAGGTRKAGTAAVISTVAIAYILKTVVGMMAGAVLRKTVGAAAAGGLGLLKGVTGMGGFATGAGAAGAGALGTMTKGLASVGKRLPIIGSLLGIGMGAMEIADANKQEREGTLSAEDASRQRGSAVGGGAGTAIGAVLGTLIGGPVGTVIGGIIGEQIGSKLGSYWPEIKSGLQTMSDVVGEFVTGAGEKVTKGLSWIGETVGNTFTKAKDIISSSWDSVTGFMGKAANMAGNMATTSVNWVAKQFSSSSTAPNPTVSPTMAPVQTPAGTTTPVITTDQLSARMLKYYDDSITKMIQMVDKLETVHNDLDAMRASAEISSERLINAIERSGPNIR